jgi:carbon-monoxide dehydrogenase medium subunit
MALDTTVTIAGREGQRSMPLSDFIVDAYTTQLGAGDMLTQISVGIPSRPCGGAYVKFEKRAGDFAVASVGVQLTLNGDRCRGAAISLGAVGATPIRARAAESSLQGQTGSPELLEKTERLVRDAAEPFADTRGSVEYKRHLAGVLFRRAFGKAMERCT